MAEKTTNTTEAKAVTRPAQVYQIGDEVTVNGKADGLVIGVAWHTHLNIPCWRYLVIPLGNPIQVANGIWMRDGQIQAKASTSKQAGK